MPKGQRPRSDFREPSTDVAELVSRAGGRHRYCHGEGSSCHLEVVKAAIEAGKHVYCEWPLGNGLAEAEELAELAKAKSVLGVVGTQARVSPEIEYLKQLITDGFVGEVLSTATIVCARRRLGRAP